MDFHFSGISVADAYLDSTI